MGWVVTYKNERETSNYDKREMILIYHLAIYYYRSGCSRLSWHRGRKVEKSRRIAKGRQVITLNLAITLRVTLVRDFVKSLFTLYIYILSLKGIFIQNRLSGAFQTRLFSYKEIWNSVYLLSCLVVAIDLEWREMYIGIVLGSGLRGDEDRKESYMLSWDFWELCWWNIE